MSDRHENFLRKHVSVIATLLLTMVMIVAAMVFYAQREEGDIAKKWVIHTYEVTDHIQLLFNRLKDVELGQRGYIIAGKDQYLVPYYDALKNSLGNEAKSDRLDQHHSISEELKILRNFTNDNPVQLGNLEEMDHDIQELLHYWDTTIKAQQKKKTSAIIAEADFNQGDQLMDRVRGLVAIMMAEENQLLKGRIERSEATIRQNNLFISIVGILFYISMVSSILLLSRYWRDAKKSAETLKTYTIAIELSNKELEQFAYVASHDLKAPLRVIDNTSKWLEEDLAPYLNDDTRENMTMLRGRVRRMEKLLDDLLEYSRIGRAIDDRYKEIISGKELMDDVLALTDIPKGFTVNVSPVFAAININRMPLQQILLNLISNAIKHHHHTMGIVDVMVEERETDYHFTVKDDGPGIAPEFQEQIFKMFQTLKPRDQVEGSGMGLAMVKKNVEVFGGILSLESTVGNGCIFHFTWPKQQQIIGRVL